MDAPTVALSSEPVVVVSSWVEPVVGVEATSEPTVVVTSEAMP